MTDKKITVHVDKKNLLIGVLLILLGVSAPVLINVYNFNIYNFLYKSLENYDQGMLMLAAIRLVLLNSFRGLPHYLGTFIIAESTDITIKGKHVPHVKGLIALVIIPLVYSAINTIHGIKYDLGVPAFIAMFSIVYLEKMNYSEISFLKKAFIIILFLMGAQWLDVIPQISRFGFGRGETSQDIKAVANIINGVEALSFFSVVFFVLFTFNAIVVSKLIDDEHRILVTTEKNKEVERRLNEARMQALQARNYIELKNLVHDLKTPLTSIQALTSVLKLMEDKPKAKSYLSRIETSVDKLNDMISEILYESKKNTISTEELFDYVLSNISPLPYAANVKYNNEAKGNMIYANKIRLSRAIINALDDSYNAIDKDKGNIYIRVYSDNERVVIEIQDNGKGIKRELLEEVKKRGFSQSESTGLGLSFIDDVVRTHNGQMCLSSEYGAGTTLKIILPKVSVDVQKNSSD